MSLKEELMIMKAYILDDDSMVVDSLELQELDGTVVARESVKTDLNFADVEQRPNFIYDVSKLAEKYFWGEFNAADYGYEVDELMLEVTWKVWEVPVDFDDYWSWH